MYNFLKIIFRFFISKKKDNYLDIDKDQYYHSFGLVKKKDSWEIKDKEKLYSAYKKACENRNYEIDKFWTRTTYFWGFLVLIFGAYISVLNKNQEFFELVLICLGIIFSTSWYFVIKGSKKWQENWEAHIDAIEDYVTGPIYKTIRHQGPVYSVSKINLILSFVVLVVWLGLLYKFLDEYNYMPEKGAKNPAAFNIIIPLLITGLFVLSIATGYAKNKYINNKGAFIRRKELLF